MSISHIPIQHHTSYLQSCPNVSHISYLTFTEGFFYHASHILLTHLARFLTHHAACSPRWPLLWYITHPAHTVIPVIAYASRSLLTHLALSLTSHILLTSLAWSLTHRISYGLISHTSHIPFTKLASSHAHHTSYSQS